MRSNVMVILAVVGTLIICGAAFAGYTVYEHMQDEKNQLNSSLQDVKNQLNESQNNTNNSSSNNDNSNQKVSSSSSSSSSGSSSGGSSVKSSSNKVTYEEAGVNKNVGYMKTCKYPGCGAVYDSRLSYCPVCGHKNIYV